VKLCQGDNTILSSIITSTNNNTASYTVNPIQYQPYNYSGTTVLNNIGNPLIDDQVSILLPINFTFCFFGNQYNQCYVGSNGWLGFSPAQSQSFTSQLVPSTNFLVPRNCIMGPWHDLNPSIASSSCSTNPTRNYIRYRTEGVAPYRRFIVSWVNIPMYQCTATCGTQQIVIYESTNIIENYIERKVSCGVWAGGTATQSLHNLAGNIAIPVPGRNSTVWVATNDAWTWIPISVIPPVINWFIDNINVSNGNTLSISNWNNGCYNVSVNAQWSCVSSIFSDNIIVCVKECCDTNTGPIYTE